jgi:choice-of-anchor C domain-containing protein
MKSAVLLALFSCAAFGSGFANGSFELNNNCDAPGGSWRLLAAGSTCITGWVVAVGTVDYSNGLWVASNGIHSVELNGDSVGGISQTFDTNPNHIYRVTFDMAGNIAGPPVVKTMIVSAAGGSQAYSFDSAGKLYTNMGWASNTFAFNSDASGSTTLRFMSTSNGDPRTGPVIDNVTVTDLGPTVTATATQSSTLAGYATAGASAAFDGSTNGNFFAGSVSHTDLEANAWWQVDLGTSMDVGSVVIWNRTDCCGSRLNDYWVFISNTPFATGDTPSTLQNRSGTWSSHQTSAPNQSTAIAAGVQGRYVRVQLAGANYLSLAEVQVLGAMGPMATQSSTLAGYPTTAASAAFDGNTNGSFFAGSVSHTNLEANAWWQVDLGSATNVGAVVIWNRTDCCGSRLNDYWVFISNAPFDAWETPSTLQNRVGTWSSHQTSAPNPSTAVPAGVQGRYVRVQLAGTNYLSLAEVQVLGTAAPTATQSSTLAGFATAGASAAFDGITNGSFFAGSVTHTNLETNPWWQVDLGSSIPVGSVVIWNRTDCCGSRLNDYWVFISDAPFASWETPSTLQNRPGTWSSHQTSAPNQSTAIAAGVQGRYVRVQLAGTNILSLAEVQIMGPLAPIAIQSSTLDGYPAARAGSAFDGNTNGNFFAGSVTHTNMEANPWWQVDMAASIPVGSVVIWNRTDCCGSRLNDYWVFISDTPFAPGETPSTLQNRAGTWSSHQTSAPSPSTAISAGVRGRYIRVQLAGANILSLAEVQVFVTAP